MVGRWSFSFGARPIFRGKLLVSGRVFLCLKIDVMTNDIIHAGCFLKNCWKLQDLFFVERVTSLVFYTQKFVLMNAVICPEQKHTAASIEIPDHSFPWRGLRTSIVSFTKEVAFLVSSVFLALRFFETATSTFFFVPHLAIWGLECCFSLDCTKIRVCVNIYIIYIYIYMYISFW